ncbi:MAG TPA: twin-arginine translocase subunit TatC, partial [Candidatus Thermoplasmatota archaeon]|nr:twin-arginine translocase subunit TatC [Candidatus Thermoplasmatota archaeon]
MEPLRVLPLALLTLVLAAPGAGAASALVTLEASGGVWNGESRVELEPTPEARSVVVWVPRDARIHAVLSSGEGDAPTFWRAAGPDALVVTAAPGADAVSVRFDVPDRRPYLVRFVAPPGVDEVTLRVRAPEGAVAESPDVAFADGRAIARVAPGDSIAVRIVEAGRVGELPLLATVGALALAVLLGTLVWHRVRPPLGGREPQRFLDHLSELQARLLPPAALFALLNLFYFTSGLRATGAFPYVLPTWGVDASISARAFDAVAERLVPPDVTLVVLRPADAVLAQVGMCLFLALATVLPLLVYELAAFIAPGLEPRERNVGAQAAREVEEVEEGEEGGRREE